MNNKFIKSIATAVAGLSIISSCSYLGLNKNHHNNCAGNNNGCKGNKKEEVKKDANICGAANGCAGNKPAAKADVKPVKSSKKVAVEKKAATTN